MRLDQGEQGGAVLSNEDPPAQGLAGLGLNLHPGAP